MEVFVPAAASGGANVEAPVNKPKVEQTGDAEEHLDVFSVSDAPVLEALGLYREREC